MRYPPLTERDIKDFSAEVSLDQSRALRTAAAVFCEARANTPRSPGSDSDAQLDLSLVDALSKKISTHLMNPAVQGLSDAQREAYESDICEDVHKALAAVPYEVLDDPRFWYYLAVKHFSEFIVWREHGALAAGNISTYFSASVESLPLRLYLRANVIFEATKSYGLTRQIPQATDFWRSHVLRVRLGRARTMAGAFASMQNTRRMPTELLRKMARFVNRTWSNVVLTEYKELESAKLLKELRTRAESSEN